MQKIFINGIQATRDDVAELLKRILKNEVVIVDAIGNADGIQIRTEG